MPHEAGLWLKSGWGTYFTVCVTGIRFEEVGLPSASPCAVCVGFAATTRYVRGAITWNICLSDQPKGYLDLKLSKNNKVFKVRLLRDCSSPATIKVLNCPTAGSDDFALNTISFSQGNSDIFITEKGSNGVAVQVLRVTIPSTYQIGIELKSGWRLDYDRQFCSGGGN